MKALLTFLAISLTCTGFGACGGSGQASKAGSTAVKPATGYMRGDEDAPIDDKGMEDDDHGTRHYGSEASAEDRSAIAAALQRYYTAAAARDGTAACALLSSALAKSHELESALPPEFLPASDSSTIHGKDCSQVESLLFEVNHNQLPGQAASMQVIDVRVKGEAALAILGFKATVEHSIPLLRENGGWKIAALIDIRLP